jgi:hypothetical protein
MLNKETKKKKYGSTCMNTLALWLWAHDWDNIIEKKKHKVQLYKKNCWMLKLIKPRLSKKFFWHDTEHII